MDRRPRILRQLCRLMLILSCLLVVACRQPSETRDTDDGESARPATPQSDGESVKPKAISDADSERESPAEDAFWNGLARESIQLDQILLVVKGSKGCAGCSYLNVGTFERFGEACAIIPAGSFDKMLDAKVTAVTSQAKALGIEVGMPGREALELLR